MIDTTRRIQKLKTELFFDISPDLFFIAGYDGYFKKVNPAVCNLFGYSEEELLAKPINDFIHKDDIEKTIKSREKVISGNTLMHYENRYITKSGEIVWLAWTSVPLMDENLVYAIAKDVTYKKRIEEERNLLLASLKKINNNLKNLTYTASHDMRSPVNNLLTVFDLLDTSKIQDEETLEFINVLKTVSEGLKDTLNNYVDNINHNDKMSLSVDRLAFQPSLDNVLLSIKSLIKESSTSFEIDFSQAETVSFNKAYLESIFINLITNAIKYSRPEVPPMITIKTKKVNGVTSLLFSDNGLGFDINKIENRIFKLNQKFHTNKDSKGIGLYLIYNHVKDLGGHIEMTSQLNKGTIFTITFKE